MTPLMSRHDVFEDLLVYATPATAGHLHCKVDEASASCATSRDLELDLVAVFDVVQTSEVEQEVVELGSCVVTLSRIVDLEVEDLSVTFHLGNEVGGTCRSFRSTYL